MGPLLLRGFICLYTSYPCQWVSGGVFPRRQVRRAEEFFQNNIGRLWIHCKVKFCTKCQIPFSYKDTISYTSLRNSNTNNRIMVLPSMLPPIMYRSLSFWGKHGSTLTANARLVSGPRAHKETCRNHSSTQQQQQKAATRYRHCTQQFLTRFWFSDTSLIIASTACSLWIFSFHRGSLSLITSPSPSVPKWSVRELLAPTRGPAQPWNTGICRRRKQQHGIIILINWHY